MGLVDIATREAGQSRWSSVKGRAVLYTVDDVMLYEPDIVPEIRSQYYLSSFIEDCYDHCAGRESDLTAVDGVGEARADSLSKVVVATVENGRYEWTVEFYERHHESIDLS